MAYVDKQPLSQRLANLGTAGLIEVGIGVALVAGLSTTFVKPDKAPPVDTFNVPTDVPSPTPEKRTEKVDDTITVVDSPFKFDRVPEPVPTSVPDPLPPTGATGTDETPTPLPSAQASPQHTPVVATPRNNPGEWVTPEDYPSGDLRRGNQGTTRFRVIVGSNGRVQSCEIVGSSGFASLDKATCDKVTRRARFEPATDRTGAKVVGSYTNAVVWRIPR